MSEAGKSIHFRYSGCDTSDNRDSTLPLVAARPRLFDNCITKNELAQHLNVSLALINKLMAEECLPHLKIGRAVRFRLNDVYAWFERKGYKL